MRSPSSLAFLLAMHCGLLLVLLHRHLNLEYQGSIQAWRCRK